MSSGLGKETHWQKGTKTTVMDNLSPNCVWNSPIGGYRVTVSSSPIDYYNKALALMFSVRLPSPSQMCWQIERLSDSWQLLSGNFSQFRHVERIKSNTTIVPLIEIQPDPGSSEPCVNTSLQPIKCSIDGLPVSRHHPRWSLLTRGANSMTLCERTERAVGLKATATRAPVRDWIFERRAYSQVHSPRFRFSLLVFVFNLFAHLFSCLPSTRVRM